MPNRNQISGKFLNTYFGINASHALYSEGGKWYHLLNSFPAALFDANGYVILVSEEEYLHSPQIRIQKEVNIPNGIKSLPGYIKISENGFFRNFFREAKENQSRSFFQPNNKGQNIPVGKERTYRKSIKYARIIRDTQVSRWVKAVHNFTCQICGKTLILPNGKRYSEAHHIQPLRAPHNGPDIIENIICVCPNDHVLLDYGAVALEAKNLFSINGHQIDEKFVNYHNTFIYVK
jgi:5-methylcytosine-specific restriction protein A